MKRSEEIVVIGAGIIGVSIAYNLALKGAKVTVLDKQTPGTGCTQGAFAMLIAGHSEGTESFNALYSLAVKEWRQLEAQLNESLPIQWGGVVNWAGPGDRSDELLVAREKLKSWGVKVHDLVEEDIRDLIAGINPGQFACGSFLPDQGVVDIDRIFAILIRHATQAGVVLMTPVEVKDGITTDSGEIMLSTTQGSIKADRLVLAAGAGVPALAEMFTGVHIPISLASGTLAYSRPMPHILHRVINGPLGSIKQDQDGRIICGPDYRPGANGTNIDPEYGQRLLDNAMKVLPALAGIKLDHMTVGHVPIPKDSVPIVGFCDNTKTRIYVATMMSGVTMAPLMGRLIASEILGQPEPLLASYRPDRFGKTPLLPPSVLIIGAGAVGISTAWHLSQSSEKRARYRSIHVLDRCPPPSSMAAATDINKIIRSEYSDPVYEKLALEALEAWNDPNAIFQKHFHPSGWLLSASGGSLPFLEQSALNARVKGVTGVKFMTPAEVRTSWPALTGDMRGWKILASPAAGWAAAGAIMVEMVGQCIDHGVVFSSGLSGHVKTLLFDEGGSCIGARTVDGTEQFADCVILAAGANTASLIDLDGQQQAVGHTVCCLQLSPQEASRYTNMTIVANIEEGCIFPPDNNNVMKIASVHMVTNYGRSKTSLPRFREDNDSDDVPDDLQKRLRRWMREVVPELAERPWSETRLCWDVETPESDFIITKHPKHNRLVVATGGSGHAFKFLPTIGGYVAQTMDDILPQKLAKKWGWKTSSLSTLGHKAMFTKTLRDLSEIPGWGINLSKL